MPLLYEPVIIENPNLARDLKTGLAFPENEYFLEKIPDDVTDGVPPEVYNAYRKGRDSECGVRAKPQALVGVYRTMSDDAIGSTLQPCYVAIVPYEKVKEKKQLDSGHGDVRLFTLGELEQIPSEHRHWYPMRVSYLVLRALQKDIPTEVEIRIRRLDSLLQPLWTKAVGTPNYDKKEWQRLVDDIWSLNKLSRDNKFAEVVTETLFRLKSMLSSLRAKATATSDYAEHQWLELERGIQSFADEPTEIEKE